MAIAHGAGEPLEGSVLELGIGDAVQRVPLPLVTAGSVVELDAAELVLPALSKGMMARVKLRLLGEGGNVINTNELELAIHPRPEPVQGSEALSAWSPDAAIQERLAELGYRIAPELTAADFAVARNHSTALAAYVRAGGRLLLCLDDDLDLQPFFPHWQNVRVKPRAGTLWQGDWASSFSWLDRSGVFGGLPGGPLLDMGFERVLPRHLIVNCNLLDFQARVHAGIVVGWIHKVAALIVERGYGKGRMVATTFRLFQENSSADPTAIALLQGLIRLTLTRKAASQAEAEALDFGDGEEGGRSAYLPLAQTGSQ
jgi:hypothetical protein